MRKKKLLSLLLLLLVALTRGHAQQATLDTLLKKFGHYREAALQEKIYAHMDRDFYLTGETLWFKIYTVDGSFHKPIDVSKVAYAEILDRANFPVLQGKIGLDNGMGNGSFFIPASLSAGSYKLRVYTSWMKNFSPEFYFDKVFTIVNPFVAPEASKTLVTSGCTVDFFPEGGNLVAGIKSKVAFKISESGRGVFCKGLLLNERNDTIATFAPEKFGLGSFLFTPEPEQKYRAILADARGARTIHPFPEAFQSGFVMQLRDSGEMLHVTVRSQNVPQQNVYLFVHARHIIAEARGQMLQNNATTFILPKAALQEGISHLTLFNEDLQPICERLYFTYPEKELEIDITSNQKIFSPRKRVSVSLQTSKEGSDTAVPASLSMAVYKIDSLLTRSPQHIFPYLWLGSDLAGAIESPEYYFKTDQPGAHAAMDNLMLTHGWRRFDWQEILQNKKQFKFLPEVREHIITAVITKEQETERSVFTYLGSPGKIIRAYGSWSNQEGEVRFEIKDFYGARRIILQAKTDSSDMYNIKIQNPFSPLTDSEKLPVLELNQKHGQALLARSIAMQVQDIYYYESFGNQPILPEVDSAAFYGDADATYYLDDYTRFPVMEEVMREYVPGVFVRKRRDGFHFIVIDQIRGGILSGDPMVLLDGVPILDVDDIMALDPLRVRKLEVVERQYYLGQAAFSGIVSYTTYKGDLGGMELDPQSLSLNYDGLQLKRRFYSPQYTREQESDRMPDQRYLLHWQPDIKTDEHGKHQEEFFTSDVPGTYLIVVEGLSEEGYAGSKTYTFSVASPDNQ